GAFGSTFFVIQRLGTRNTLWLACLVNATTALTAFAISRGRSAGRIQQPTLSARTTDSSLGDGINVAAAPHYVTYAASGLAGFSFFLMELVWYRMLGPILGGTTFTFGLVLTVALTGIGLGAAAYSWIFSRHRQVSIDSLALICVLEACCLLLPFVFGD